ncbi:MAG: hypothetical protein FJ164_09410 [Gammaproteobacteria bacterium]|nr:hypothetical protein [Gammaproteobacteria bacterium]
MRPPVTNRYFVTRLQAACLVAFTCLLLACREPERKPKYEYVQRPAPVEAPESPDTAPAGASGGAAAGGAAGPGEAQGQQPAEQYLPPSEQGAEVQITETPADGSASAEAPTAPGEQQQVPEEEQAGAQSAGTGGAVPAEGARKGGSPPPGSAATHQGASQQTPAATVGGSEDLSAAAARTREEEAQALEEELQRKLQEFDARMKQQEQDAAKARAGAAGMGSPESDADAGRGGLLERPPEGTGAGGRAGQATGLGNTPDLSGETSGSARSTAGGPGLAPIEQADDDIVARQLREAAEREADPALKEKLWQEYRNYKGGP